jgi:hypothetical protein
MSSDDWAAHDKRVCILGFAESYKQAHGLTGDATCDVWGLNELWKYLPTGRWSRWWEVHDADTLGITTRDLSEGEQKRHLQWLSTDHGPDKIIYMQPQLCDGRYPNAKPYPLEAMCEQFGRYFTSSIGYMLAMALVEDYTAIQLAGVDLVSDVEYPGQRPNTEYLIGIARGQGRLVEIPSTSALLKAGHLYGYESPISQQGGVLSAVQSHKGNLLKMHEQKLAELNTLDGAIQECDNFAKLHEYKERGAHVETY